MTVGELKEKLKDIPNDLNVLAEGEEADKVIIENCKGNRYVRIFKAWDVDFVGRGEQDEITEHYKKLGEYYNGKDV